MPAETLKRPTVPSYRVATSQKSSATHVPIAFQPFHLGVAYLMSSKPRWLSLGWSPPAAIKRRHVRSLLVNCPLREERRNIPKPASWISEYLAKELVWVTFESAMRSVAAKVVPMINAPKRLPSRYQKLSRMSAPKSPRLSTPCGLS